MPQIPATVRVLQAVPQLPATFLPSESNLISINLLVRTDHVVIRAGDVVGGSPLNVISYVGNGTGTIESRQVFRVYYQSVLGNIKEAVMNGLGSWGDAE